MTLNEKEQKEWDNFLAHCEKGNLEIPENYKGTGNLGLRYLQACKWNYDKTQAAIMNHSKWITDSCPHEYP